MLYVRTEGSEHLFVMARHRIVFQRKLAEVPEEFELIVDAEERERANEERALRFAADHDCSILAGLLKKACDWLPPARARQLRLEWRESQP